MIEVDKVTSNRFTMLINDTSGEGQLVIIMSPGQGSRTPLIVISARCDGYAKVIYSTSWIKMNMVATQIELIVRWWLCEGVPKQNNKKVEANVVLVMRAFSEKFCLDDCTANMIEVDKTAKRKKRKKKSKSGK